MACEFLLVSFLTLDKEKNYNIYIEFFRYSKLLPLVCKPIKTCLGLFFFMFTIGENTISRERKCIWMQ